MEHGEDAFRAALERMRREFGPDAFRNPKRMTAILRDLAPGKEAECNALRQIAERGLLEELAAAADADDVQRGRVMMKLRACLSDYLQLSEERAEYYTALLLDFYGIPRTWTLTDAGREGDLSWTLDERGALTVSCTGPMPNYQFADGSVNCPWWIHRGDIVSARIADGVTAVGDSAFYGCGALETAALPDSVERIGEWAFADCARLNFVRLPAGVRRIERGAFSDCAALSEIDIPDGVSVIESWTFRNCPRLRRVTIPESVVSIGQRAFEGCTLLTHAHIPAAVRIEPSAFDASVILTRPAPEELPDPPTAPPRRKSRKSANAYADFALPLLALTVLLRHGLFAFPLLALPFGLLLWREGS